MSKITNHKYIKYQLFNDIKGESVCQALFRSKKSGNKEFFSQKSGGYQKIFSIKVVLYSVLNGLNHEDSAIKC